MTILADLERARRLAFAADEVKARDLLLSLVPAIEAADRDDWLLEVYAQLGEIYLVRTAYDGTEESVSRIRECLATYTAIRAGTRGDLAAKVTMSDAEVDHMVCRYSRRAQFLQTGLAAAHGDHEAAEAALLVLTDDTAVYPDLADEHGHLVTFARILCANALCEDDLHVQSVPFWEKVIDTIDHSPGGSEFDDYLLVLGATSYGRFCIETGRLPEAEPWLRRAGARAEARGWALGTARTQFERATAAWAVGDRAQAQRPGSRGLSGDRRELAGARCVALLAVLRSDRPLDREARRRRRAFRQRRAALARDREAAAHPSHSVAAQLG